MVKRYHVGVVIGVLAVVGSAADAGVEATVAPAKNLLLFGNSFTQSGGAGGVGQLVSELAVAGGHAEPFVFQLAVGGRALDWHLAYGTPLIADRVPAGQTWDHVVMQEFSTRPTDHPTMGEPQKFYDAASGLASAVRAHSPDAGVVLFETWARGPGHEFYPGEWASPEAMQAQLAHHYSMGRDAVDAAVGGTATEVARVGSAFGEAGFDASLYGSDVWHASNRGALLAGLMIYASIYDDATLTDLDFTAVANRLGMSEADAVGLAQVAERTIPAPAPIAMLAIGVVWAQRRR